MSGDPIMASVDMFAGNFAPRGWGLCDGRLLPIAQNSALFSLLGTIYGGDGRTTFALPDMRGRTPIGTGHGAGLSARTLGEIGGGENTTLTVDNLPAHSHDFLLFDGRGDSNNGQDASLAKKPIDATEGSGESKLELFKDATPSVALNTSSIRNTGGGQGFTNMQPFLVLNFCIALQGIYPSRA